MLHHTVGSSKTCGRRGNAVSDTKVKPRVMTCAVSKSSLNSASLQVAGVTKCDAQSQERDVLRATSSKFYPVAALRRTALQQLSFSSVVDYRDIDTAVVIVVRKRDSAGVSYRPFTRYGIKGYLCELA